MTAAAAPLVSVLIPVYNRAALIGDAVRSIAAQTLGDLEIVVLDDGSTDGSAETARAVGDPRLRIVAPGGNRGIPAARNAALAAARGRYIAWLDSDDRARPGRLAAQISHLERHPEVAMVGCCAGRLDAAGRARRGARVPPLAHEDVAAWLLFRSAFQQSAITGRAEVLRRYPYAPDHAVCEDLDMFVRIARDHRVENLPQVLIDRRMHEGQTIHAARARMRDFKVAVLAAPLRALGVAPNAEDLARHVQLGNPKQRSVAPDRAFLDWAAHWLGGLQVANRASGYVDAEGLRLACAYFWLLACRSAAREIGAPAAIAAAARSPGAALTGARGRRWLTRALPLFAGRG